MSDDGLSGASAADERGGSSEGEGTGVPEVGRGRSTLLAMIIVVALRKWLEQNRGVRLTDDDVDELLGEVDGLPESLGVIGSLRGAAAASIPALSWPRTGMSRAWSAGPWQCTLMRMMAPCTGARSCSRCSSTYGD
ncbi:hypothetical protein [Bifidobacterium olomucense]|uniref:hypothetical protein n=1 Tax=Bifidobacterium olomucense TaxID=2675324 RepID=UPI00145E903D|nr:hypothetical protein [Bifidobacterium sp. DSM 109959]